MGDEEKAWWRARAITALEQLRDCDDPLPPEAQTFCIEAQIATLRQQACSAADLEKVKTFLAHAGVEVESSSDEEEEEEEEGGGGDGSSTDGESSNALGGATAQKGKGRKRRRSRGRRSGEQSDAERENAKRQKVEAQKAKAAQKAAREQRLKERAKARLAAEEKAAAAAKEQAAAAAAVQGGGVESPANKGTAGGGDKGKGKGKGKGAAGAASGEDDDSDSDDGGTKTRRCDYGEHRLCTKEHHHEGFCNVDVTVAVEDFPKKIAAQRCIIDDMQQSARVAKMGIEIGDRVEVTLYECLCSKTWHKAVVTSVEPVWVSGPHGGSHWVNVERVRKPRASARAGDAAVDQTPQKGGARDRGGGSSSSSSSPSSSTVGGASGTILEGDAAARAKAQKREDDETFMREIIVPALNRVDVSNLATEDPPAPDLSGATREFDDSTLEGLGKQQQIKKMVEYLLDSEQSNRLGQAGVQRGLHKGRVVFELMRDLGVTRQQLKRRGVPFTTLAWKQIFELDITFGGLLGAMCSGIPQTTVRTNISLFKKVFFEPWNYFEDEDSAVCMYLLNCRLVDLSKKERCVGMVRRLLTEGADPAFKLLSDNIVWTALHGAAMAGRDGNMKAMLEKVPQGGDALNMQIQVEQDTPLHTAVTFGKTGIVKLLFKHGAALETQNAMGKTPLGIAGELMGARGKEAFKAWFAKAIAVEKKKRA